MVSQYKTQIDGIMKREVTRNEFLSIVGVLILGFIGVIGFFKNLHESIPTHRIGKNQAVPVGYNRGAYNR